MPFLQHTTLSPSITMSIHTSAGGDGDVRVLCTSDTRNSFDNGSCDARGSRTGRAVLLQQTMPKRRSKASRRVGGLCLAAIRDLSCPVNDTEPEPSHGRGRHRDAERSDGTSRVLWAAQAKAQNRRACCQKKLLKKSICGSDAGSAKLFCCAAL